MLVVCSGLILAKSKVVDDIIEISQNITKYKPFEDTAYTWTKNSYLILYVKVGHSFRTYAKFSKIIIFVTPWYTHVHISFNKSMNYNNVVVTKQIYFSPAFLSIFLLAFLIILQVHYWRWYRYKEQKGDLFPCPMFLH